MWLGGAVFRGLLHQTAGVVGGGGGGAGGGGWGGGQPFVGCFNKLLVSLANRDRLVDPMDMQGLTLGRDRARDYFQFFRVNICADTLVSTRPRVYTDRLCTLKIPCPPLDKRRPNSGGGGGGGGSNAKREAVS